MQAGIGICAFYSAIIPKTIDHISIKNSNNGGEIYNDYM